MVWYVHLYTYNRSGTPTRWGSFLPAFQMGPYGLVYGASPNGNSAWVIRSRWPDPFSQSPGRSNQHHRRLIDALTPLLPRLTARHAHPLCPLVTLSRPHLFLLSRRQEHKHVPLRAVASSSLLCLLLSLLFTTATYLTYITDVTAILSLL
jgi:hypothetical protein